ncbi:MAG: radical SAM protein [Clostridia bacterium]|nr:radical SAM protein [Clostridia bacterium]
MKIEQTPFPYRLTECVWEITLACCFSCRYCGSGGGKARADELSTDECLDLAAQLDDLGCQRVNLIGGEVFMRRDWKTIVSELTRRGMSVTIITNGFLFTNALIDDIRTSGIESVAVSLDATEAIHDAYRQEGSYRRALRAIEALTDAGISVSVISTLNRENAEHLEELYAVLEQYPLFAWQLQACSPMGNAANRGVDYRFDPRKVIAFIERHYKTAPFLMGMADNIGYFTEHEDTLRGNPRGGAPFIGCRAGLRAVGIDSVGNIRGCESMYDDRFIEGNIREKSLREIWENPDGFAYNRRFTPELLTGTCATCPNGPYCAGGCRSYNYFVHKKLYEAPCCASAAKEEPSHD